LHPGAVYLYEAETYVVKELDISNRLVFVSRKDVDYYTQSLKHTNIYPLQLDSTKIIGPNKNIECFFGDVKVEHDYYAYKVIDTLTQETISRNPLDDIPLIKFESQAVWFEIPFELQKQLELENYDLGGTIHAIEHAMIAMAPALAQISRWDLGGVSIDFDPVKQSPIIYIYDAYRGGIGISELLYEKLEELMMLTFKLINSCSCKTPNGCPACIMSPKCGNGNEPLDKSGATFLLSRLLSI
jgi:DEAD/DEAH box helicase domain-containing protein